VAPNPEEDTPTLSSFADMDTAGSDDPSESGGDTVPPRNSNNEAETESRDTTTDPRDTDGGSTDEATPSFVAPADRPRAETVELGVELLAAAAEEALPLPEAVDRVETVTRDPTLVREVLDTAETRGVIEREEASVKSRVRGPTLELDRRVVRRDGDYDCRRCGKSLSTGHFLRFETGEIGPFGSSCVKKVTGRE
jgi:hypothetical protein